MGLRGVRTPLGQPSVSKTQVRKSAEDDALEVATTAGDIDRNSLTRRAFLLGTTHLTCVWTNTVTYNRLLVAPSQSKPSPIVPPANCRRRARDSRVLPSVGKNKPREARTTGPHTSLS